MESLDPAISILKFRASYGSLAMRLEITSTHLFYKFSNVLIAKTVSNVDAIRAAAQRCFGH